MHYLPDNQDYVQKQYDYFHIEKPLEDRPGLKNYGIPVAYGDLEKISEDKGYIKVEEGNYNRPGLNIDILSPINSILVREMPPGLRGYCIPAMRILFVREGDPDPNRVSDHENYHIRLFTMNPFHREHEIRELEHMRHGYEYDN